MNGRDIWEAREIGDVQGENLMEAVNFHQRCQPGIVYPNSADFQIANESTPHGIHSSSLGRQHHGTFYSLHEPIGFLN
jgi:hypothetical protein